jgi:hypothetical protein
MSWVETLLLRQILADLQRRQMPTQTLALVVKFTARVPGSYISSAACIGPSVGAVGSAASTVVTSRGRGRDLALPGDRTAKVGPRARGRMRTDSTAASHTAVTPGLGIDAHHFGKSAISSIGEP